MTSNGLVLPEDVLRLVFELLSPRDLKAVVMVCPLWRELGEAPRLWTWAVVRVSSMEDLQKANIRRLGMLQEIKVLRVENWLKKKSQVDKMFHAISEIPTVTRLSGLGMCQEVSCVDPQLLVTVVNRLEKLTLWRFLTAEQLELLFREMADTTNLKILGLVYNNPTVLEIINPAVFSDAISNVVKVRMYGDISSEQLLTALFGAISDQDRPLRKLWVATDTIIDMTSALLGKAINRLEEVEWVGRYGVRRLRADQVHAILRTLVEGGSRLKKLMLWLDSATVEELDDDLVRRAEEKVGEFYRVV